MAPTKHDSCLKWTPFFFLMKSLSCTSRVLPGTLSYCSHLNNPIPLSWTWISLPLFLPITRINVCPDDLTCDVHLFLSMCPVSAQVQGTAVSLGTCTSWFLGSTATHLQFSLCGSQGELSIVSFCFFTHLRGRDDDDLSRVIEGGTERDHLLAHSP